MTKLYNQTEQLNKRRRLRTAATWPERLLWYRLQGRAVAGLKFRRQYSVGPYVLDFYCPAARLAVELDGAGHYEGAGPARDADRDAFLARFGIRTIRFPNDEVLTNLDGVVTAVALAAGAADV